jgi:hypothetical protein
VAVLTDVDLAVRDGQRRRRVRWLLGLVAVVVVVAAASAWAWSDRVYLWDDYRAGWNVAKAGEGCTGEMKARYPEARWAASDSDIAEGPSSRSPMAFRLGCLDYAAGSRFAPWHVMEIQPD